MDSKHEHRDEELKALEQSLKQRVGTGSFSEPPATYWATFRPRVVARLKDGPSVWASWRIWIMEHRLSSSAIGLGFAMAILVSIIGIPNRTVVPSHVAQQSGVQQSSVQQSTAQFVDTAQVGVASRRGQQLLASNVQPVIRHSKSDRAITATHASSKISQNIADESTAGDTINEQPLLTGIPFPGGASQGESTNLENLSTTELAAIYAGLTSTDSTGM